MKSLTVLFLMLLSPILQERNKATGSSMDFPV